MPALARGLELDGKELWERVWTAGATWISPTTDTTAVEQACRLADDVSAARRRYQVTTDPADGRILVQLQRALIESLAALGFTPTSRSRLGVAEVTVASKLDALRRGKK